MSEAAWPAAPAWPVIAAALDRLPKPDAGRLRGLLAKTTDPRLYRQIADHVLSSARLLDDPGFRRAMADARRNPPDWSGPERSLAEWRALVHGAGSARQVSRRLVGIRDAAWPYLCGPDEDVAWDEIGRIQRRTEGPTRMVPGSQGFMNTLMPNGDSVIWVPDDVDERFEVLYVGPLAGER